MPGYDVLPPGYSSQTAGVGGSRTIGEDENKFPRGFKIGSILPRFVDASKLEAAKALIELRYGRRSDVAVRERNLQPGVEEAFEDEEGRLMAREVTGEEAEGEEVQDQGGRDEEMSNREPKSRGCQRGAQHQASTSKIGWKRAKPGQSMRTVTNRREAFGKTYSAFVKNDSEYPRRIIEESMGIKIEYDRGRIELKAEAWNRKHLKPLQARLLLGEALMRLYDELMDTPSKRRNVGPNTFQWFVAGDIDVNSGSMMGKRMGEECFTKHALNAAKHRAVLHRVMRDLAKWEKKGHVLFQHLGAVVPKIEDQRST